MGYDVLPLSGVTGAQNNVGNTNAQKTWLWFKIIFIALLAFLIWTNYILFTKPQLLTQYEFFIRQKYWKLKDVVNLNDLEKSLDLLEVTSLAHCSFRFSFRLLGWARGNWIRFIKCGEFVEF
jgi:hypothetical protein